MSLAAVLASACAPPERPPDRVVLITIDTLRADHLGSYGYAGAGTPNLDAIAAGGVRFATTLSPTPLTLPSHASLMTGRDPTGHGVRHNGIYRLGSEVPTLAESLGARGYATAAFVGALVLDRRFGLARGFDHYDDRVSAPAAGLIGFAERPADGVIDAAVAWLEGAPQRFFLWIHLYDPHAPYKPPPGFASAFASRPYDGEIAFADAQIGRLLGVIAKRFGEGGTLVAVTSDHGESLGEHGEGTHAYTIYDATQRVPLLLKGPGLPAGRVVEATARLIDVAPTLLARVGAAPLADAGGRDLAGLIDGSEVEERLAYLETLAPRLDFDWSPLRGLRSRRFKYIHAPRPELYDLSLDPGETENRADEHPEVVAHWAGRLSERGGGFSAPAVDLLPTDRERLRSLGYVVAPRPVGDLDLTRVEGRDPKDGLKILSVIGAATTAVAAGRLEEALALLRSLGDEGPAVAFLRGSVALGAGHPEAAERDARQVLVSQPGRTDAWLVLGRALEAQGDDAAARDAYVRAAALDPGVHAPSALRLARAAATAGDRDAALRILMRAAERHPADLDLAAALADLLARSPEGG